MLRISLDKYFEKNYHSLVQNAPLAQLVEQLTLNQWAEGSSPSRSTIITC